MPDSWRVTYTTAADMADTAWWEQFQDPVLNDLIAIALNENKDLMIAAARVEEFAGRLQAGRSGFFPQIGYGLSTIRHQKSLERETPFLPREDRTNSIYQAGLNVSWELDIWGRIRRANEAARSELLSAEEARQAVVLTLVTSVADGYLELLSLDRQLEITRETLEERSEWLQLFEKKDKGGQISGLELAQVRSAYEQTAAHIATLELRIAQQENALSVLLGRNPGPIGRGKMLDMLGLLAIPQDIPSALLSRRPDIRQKEQNLIAAQARIGEVRTRYFPTISLTGLFGYASTQLSDLLQGSANIWDIGAGIVGPIFTAGRIKGEIRQVEARQRQLLGEYLKTVQTALMEVEDSLLAVQKLRELSTIQDRHIGILNDYSKFARNRYDVGYSNYLEIMDAERNLYSARIQRTQTQASIFSSVVNLYKAMGGGWVANAERETAVDAQIAEAGEANELERHDN
jgi:multidrug efflux system outer membrane protein